MSSFYVPAAHQIPDEDQVRALVAAVGVAQLVTVGPDGEPDATLVPILWRADRVVAHLATANPHARRLGDRRALLVVTGPDSYVSPSWYATTAQHGRVVPTWNYSAVQLRGRLRVVTDPDRLLAVVTALTERHEAGRPHPWEVGDAPAEYVRAQLRAIVGVEIEVDAVAAKAKLSQNRTPADQAGVIEGLTRDGGPRGLAVADQMRAEQLRAEKVRSEKLRS
jgi:transcriptional regulator